MNVRQRVLSSRLIQKIEKNITYANQIGLSYSISAAGSQKNKGKIECKK